MPKYEFNEEKAFFVYYGVIENIIAKEYGFKEYSIVASEEVGNDVALDMMNIDGRVDEWDRKIIDDREESYSLHAYLNDLADRGIISKGRYIIRISW
ncbi:MAG: hypothetical protein ACXABY_21210 [Candidatus Thorarchaeota archaeon]|jgi:hypothetical protein